MSKVMTIVVAVVAIGVGVGVGFFVFDKSKDLANLRTTLTEREQGLTNSKAALSERDKETANLNGIVASRDKELGETKTTLGSRDKEIVALKADVDKFKAASSQDQAALVGKLSDTEKQLSTTEAARKKMLGQAKQLAELSRDAEALRVADKRVRNAMWVPTVLLNSASLAGWIVPDTAKVAAEELVTAVGEFKKVATTFLAHREAAADALNEQGLASPQIPATDLLACQDKLAEYAAKTQELLGTLKIKNSTVFAHEDWKGSIRAEKGDYLLIKVENVRWKLDTRKIGVGPMGGGGTTYVTESDTVSGNDFAPEEVRNAIAVYKVPLGVILLRVRGSDQVRLANTFLRPGVFPKLVADMEGELEFRCNAQNLVGVGTEQKCGVQVIVLPKKAYEEWQRTAAALGL